ncbi:MULTISPECIES: hypothetical protein [unclassified Caballeronia]|uniref:hypothetical protein n=1 Tax=unclassified Caballeronia TaxID=2646786 RepID=UPI002860716D|nr:MULTISPECIES: hypothetical protein [unclassified Caballeronia]MDR5777357.1 hypothetical protein [Caballeronia sp. LZ002]MDR5802529.1 hypothetical protein [Caballeronia sp. LZ001]MDR5852795.1 hypothetical protein [Caballeronia sp. LZ003]
MIVRASANGDEAYRKYTKRLIGRVVTVTKWEMQGAEVCWAIRRPFWMRIDGVKTRVTGIHDSLLQPIRGAAAREVEVL